MLRLSPKHGTLQLPNDDDLQIMSRHNLASTTVHFTPESDWWTIHLCRCCHIVVICQAAERSSHRECSRTALPLGHSHHRCRLHFRTQRWTTRQVNNGQCPLLGSG